AESQDRVVGWCHVLCIRLLESEGYAELGGLVVDQYFRRCGIGQALVQDAERWAIARGIGRLRAYSGNHRNAAHQFYLQIGYVQRETSVFQKHLIIGSDD
ncbi:MAG: GNAT family N-acetyltransferase, partial [Planctomycetota bacterium]